MEINNCIRFATAGSVDDGKSTLIGRLLYDLDQLKTDQIEALHKDGELNLAFATDGLTEEREKGITIDVAYRYFTGHNTRFVSVDAPGHEEYLKNAFTAFTQVQTVVLLIDATIGIRPQLKRHLAICEMLQIPNTIIAVNKLDAVVKPESTYFSLLAQLTIPAHSICIPISALLGDNVAFKSKKFNWYNGPTLIELIANSKTVLSPYPHIRFEGSIASIHYAKLEGSTALLNQLWQNTETGTSVTINNLLVNGKSNWQLSHANAQEPIALTYNAESKYSYLTPTSSKAFEFGNMLQINCFWLLDKPKLSLSYQFNINKQMVEGTIVSIAPLLPTSDTESYFFTLCLSLKQTCLTNPYLFGSSIGTVTIQLNNLVVAGGVVV